MKTVLLFVFAGLALAQNPGVQVNPVTSDPAGSTCSSPSLLYLMPNGTLYTCHNGVVTVVAGSSSTTTICSGAQALGTSAIASGAAATTVTITCTGLLSTDTVMVDFNGSPLAVTGFVPSASGMLGIIKWPSANTINISVVNNTGGSITPGAITVNYRAVR